MTGSADSDLLRHLREWKRLNLEQRERSAKGRKGARVRSLRGRKRGSGGIACIEAKSRTLDSRFGSERKSVPITNSNNSILSGRIAAPHAFPKPKRRYPSLAPFFSRLETRDLPIYCWTYGSARSYLDEWVRLLGDIGRLLREFKLLYLDFGRARGKEDAVRCRG